jgi:flagellar biogenesis protein FliO
MAHAARFSAVLLGACSIWGACLRAEDGTGSISAPATSSLASGTYALLGGGGGVSLLGYALTILVLGAAGLTVLFRGGLLGVSWGSSKVPRKLHIEESRTVGNRQHLAVVEYEGRRVLLGISPGRIDYLCGLDSETSEPSQGFSQALSDVTASAPLPARSDLKGERQKEVL